MKQVRIFILFAVITLLSTVSAFALDPGSYTINIDCMSNGLASLNWSFDRDNTGSGSETYRAYATDGAGTIILDYSETYPVGFFGTFSPDLWTTAPAYNPITQYIVSVAGNGLPEVIEIMEQGECAGLPYYTQEPLAGLPARNLYDGRINNVPGHDVAAPVAIYCSAEDNIEIYTIDPITGEGTLVILTPKAAEAQSSPYTIDEVSGVLLSMLPDGMFQVNTTYPDGKPYIFVWEGCGESKYHLAW